MGETRFKITPRMWLSGRKEAKPFTSAAAESARPLPSRTSTAGTSAARARS